MMSQAESDTPYVWSGTYPRTAAPLTEGYDENFDRDSASEVAESLAGFARQVAHRFGRDVAVSVDRNEIEIGPLDDRSLSVTVFGDEAFRASYYPADTDDEEGDGPLFYILAEIDSKGIASMVGNFIKSGMLEFPE